MYSAHIHIACIHSSGDCNAASAVYWMRFWVRARSDPTPLFNTTNIVGCFTQFDQRRWTSCQLVVAIEEDQIEVEPPAVRPITTVDVNTENTCTPTNPRQILAGASTRCCAITLGKKHLMSLSVQTVVANA
jgi:hypothetical protein